MTDTRQRYAEALAAKFTESLPRYDRKTDTDWIDKPEPADRVDFTMSVSFIAGDGDPAWRMVTCNEAAEVCAAVRDEELERLRTALASYEKTITWNTPCHACAGTLDSAYAETVRAEQAEAEVARLRAGESAEPAPEGVQLTPAQWIHHWNRATPEKRLDTADWILDLNAKIGRCQIEDHAGAFTELAAAIATIVRVRDLAEQWKWHGTPPFGEPLRDLLAALNGQEVTDA